MARPTTLSSDDDLITLVEDVGSLPNMAPYHEAACDEILDYLANLGWSTTQLADLTADTIAVLKKPAKHYVLYLLYQAPTHGRSETLFERAIHHLNEYKVAIRATLIESNVTTEEEPTKPASGYVRLG